MKHSGRLSDPLFFKAVLLSILLFLSGCAELKTASKQPVPLDAEIIQGQLENGLTYYIKPNAYPEQRVSLNLVIHSGSLQEEDDQQGIAHFVEHLAYNDSENFPDRKAIDFMESIGMPLGSHANAFTDFDNTQYILTVPTDVSENMGQAILLLRDVLTGVRFTEPAIYRERGAVLEEIRTYKNRAERIGKKIRSIRLAGSRWLERSPEGLEKQVAAFQKDDFERFYRRWYRPDNAALIIAGDIDPEQAKALLQKHFASVARSDKPLARQDYPVPDITTLQAHTVTDPEQAENDVNISLYSRMDPRVSLEDIFQNKRESIINDLLHERLQEKAREQATLLNAFVYWTPGLDRRGLTQINARVEDGEFEPGLRILLEEIERVRQHGFTESEIKRNLQTRLSNYRLMLENRETIDSEAYLFDIVNHYLYREPALNPDQRLKYEIDFQQQLTPEQLNLQARKTLGLDQAIIWFFGPENITAETPDSLQVSQLAQSIASEQLSPWADDTGDKAIMDPLPDRVSPLTTHHFPDVDIYQWTFGNGATVLFKPTAFKADDVQLYSWSPGGTSAIPESLYRPALIAPEIVTESGLGSHNAATIEKLLSGKQVSQSTFVEEDEHGIQMWTTKNSLESALQLFHLSYKAPRVDPVIVERTRRALIDYQAKRRLDPSEVFSDDLSIWLYRNHLYARPWTQEDADSISVESTREVYNHLFSGVNGVAFILIGNIPANSAEEMASRYIGSLPGNNPVLQAVDMKKRPRTGQLRFKKELQIEPKTDVTLFSYRLNIDWNEKDATQLESLSVMLGEHLLNVLRNDKASVYSIDSHVQLVSSPVAHSRAWISFTCAPEKADELIATVWHEISQLQQLSPEAKKQWQVLLKNEAERLDKRYQENLRENSWWLARIYHAVSHDLPLEHIARPHPAPTLDEVSYLARRYLQRANSVEAVLAPKPQIEDNQATVQPAP
ncbi:M16 family metallopeptidase [Endozoicomonadaceae bacterium StTr2]